MHKFGSSDLPRGPNGECRPIDPVALAAAVVRIATGESDEAIETAQALREAEAEWKAGQSEPCKGRPDIDR